MTSSAFARVLRHHRIISWILGVSLLLAWMGSLPARVAFGRILDHSLDANRLVNGFDLAAFGELMGSSEISMGSLCATSVAQFVVFFAYLLFLAGGIYTAYRSEHTLNTAEFFQACGGAFWHMLRLTLVSLIPFALLGAGLALLVNLGEHFAESPNERTGDYALWLGLLLLGLLMLWVRAWFDLAQARTVAGGEQGMFRVAIRSFGLVTRRLYASYLGIAALRLALLAAGLWLWTYLSPESTLKSFLLLEVLVLVQIVTRLWQRAASVRALETIERS